MSIRRRTALMAWTVSRPLIRVRTRILWNQKPWTLNKCRSHSTTPDDKPRYQRVWSSDNNNSNTNEEGDNAESTTTTAEDWVEWKDRVIDITQNHKESLQGLLDRIEAQEVSGGRMRQKQYGVLHQDPATDMRLLQEGYTSKALAAALRDREDSLQLAATLAAQEDWTALAKHLEIFHPKYVLERRYYQNHDGGKKKLYRNVTETLDKTAIEAIRKRLGRMPRSVTQAHASRAAVVLALCTVDGQPCLLLEKRAPHLRAHPDEVCLPGGMVCEVQDSSVGDAATREMREEIGGLDENAVDTLGVFRCNWGDVHHLVGVAVTPVVVHLGELPSKLSPNPDEVAQVFTVSLKSLADKHLWVHKEGLAPIFVGGPYVIWGLTGYILERFGRDVLWPQDVLSPPN